MTLSGEAVEALRSAAGLYEEIQRTQGKLDTSFEAFREAYNSALTPYYSAALDNLWLKEQEMDDETKTAVEFLRRTLLETAPDSETLKDISLRLAGTDGKKSGTGFRLCRVSYLSRRRSSDRWANREERSIQGWLYRLYG